MSDKYYTFDEMKDKFGVGFRASVMGIGEVFIGCSSETTHYSSEEEAKKSVEAVWRHRYDVQVRRLTDIVKAYEELHWYKRLFSFLFKQGYKKDSIVNARMLELQKELDSNLESVYNKPVSYLSRGVYTRKLPELFVGQELYISVVHHNILKEGVHKVVVNELKYHLWYSDNTTLSYKATVTASDGTELTLQESNDEGVLTTGFSYHEVHLDRQPAVNLVSEYYKSRMQELNIQIGGVE